MPDSYTCEFCLLNSENKCPLGKKEPCDNHETDFKKYFKATGQEEE